MRRSFISAVSIVFSTAALADTCLEQREDIMRMYESLSAYVGAMQDATTESVVQGAVTEHGTDAEKALGKEKVREIGRAKDRAFKHMMDEMTYVSEVCANQGTSKQGTERRP